MNINKTLRESDLIMKYKSSYMSACIDFSFHILCTCSCFYLIWYFRNSWLSICTIPFLCGILLRNFIVFHDCCHNSYTPNKILNYVISHITGALTTTGPNWILDHHTHHLTNGNIENKQHYFFNETVLLTKNKFKTKSNIEQTIIRVYKNPLVFFTIIPIIYFGIIQRFIYIVKKYRHPYSFEQSMLTISLNHIINNVITFIYLYIIYEFGIMGHYIAGYILFSSTAFIIFHNQHSYNPSYVVGNTEWTQRNSGLLGSAYIQIPYLLKYFFMGIEYHHIHHINAKIPGYNLQAYHEEVVSNRDIFDNITKLSISDCYNNLWLALYDEDNKKYITIAELDEKSKSS